MILKRYTTHRHAITLMTLVVFATSIVLGAVFLYKNVVAAPPNDYTRVINTAVGATPVTATFSLEQIATQGYQTTNPNVNYTTAGSTSTNLRVLSNPAVSNDVITYKANVTGTTGGYIPVVRLSQTIGSAYSTGNNEASVYTISWTGGTGSATYSDTATPSVNIYQNNSVPSTFNIDNREIEGLGTSGTIANGGSFTTYQIKNAGTKWYVDFPAGATDITITKKVFNGSVCQGATSVPPSNAYPWTDPACGIDALYPYYGRLATSGSPGESYNEFLAFSVNFVGVPYIQKSFTPNRLPVGGVSRLTINAVNGSDLSAKPPFSFTDNLPSGLVVASTPNFVTTCNNGSLTSGGTAGATTLSLSGELLAGEAGCSFSINVTAAAAGDYTNGPSNLTNMNSIYPPAADAAVNFVDTYLTLNKALSANRSADTDQFTMEIHSGSLTGPLVSSTATATTGGTGAAVTTNTGTTGATPVTGGNTYYFVEKASGTTELARYAQTLTCADSEGLQAGLPLDQPISGSYAITPVLGARIACTLTNRLYSNTLTLTKNAPTHTDVNNNIFVDAGDTLVYTFTVKNDGEQALDNLVIDDPMLSSISCLATTLAPGATTTCTAASYTISAVNQSATSIINTASATATNPGGAVIASNDSSITTATGTGMIGLTKFISSETDTNADGLRDAGDTITYGFTVKNTGDLPVTGVAVTDAMIGGPITCTPTTLAPNASANCTASTDYTISTADQTNGTIHNTATASANTTQNGTTIPLSASDALDTTVTTPPAHITLKKALNGPRYADTDQFTVEIHEGSSTGPVVSSPTAATTTGTGATIDTTSGTTGSYTANPSKTYYLREAASGTTNLGRYEARITCTDAKGIQTGLPTDAILADYLTITPASSSNISCTITNRLYSEGLSLVKHQPAHDDKNNNSFVDAGDTLSYTFTVTNTGEQTLNNIVVMDAMVGSVTCTPTALIPGAQATCAAAPYIVTSNDQTALQIINTASATGIGLQASVLTSNDSTVTTHTGVPKLSIDKSIHSETDTNTNGIRDTGDTIIYQYIVRNTGDLTITGVSVTDEQIGAIVCNPSTLAPGESVTCIATRPYIVTTADQQRGFVFGGAVASGNSVIGLAMSQVESNQSALSSPTTALPAQTTLSSTGTPLIVPAITAGCCIIGGILLGRYRQY